MPDPSIAAAVVVLVALIESSGAIRLPLGLVLAIALLTSDSELLPIALLGAVGVMVARLALAVAARRGRDRLGAASPAAQAQREALRRQLTGSPSYVRVTFLISALPGVPASFLFPLLGAMRAPLWPALLGTVVGRLPVLALTTALFVWVGRLGDTADRDAAIALGVLAGGLLIIRTIAQIDWEHRAATGKWRLRDTDSPAMRMSGMFTGEGMGGPTGAGSPFSAQPRDPYADDPDVVEGEVLGEEVVEPGAIEPPRDRDQDDDSGPGAAGSPADRS